MSNQLYKVFTPNTGFNGVRLGVSFVKGVGQADEETARELVNTRGYSCPELGLGPEVDFPPAEPEPGDPSPGDPGDPNSEKTKSAELKPDDPDSPSAAKKKK